MNKPSTKTQLGRLALAALFLTSSSLFAEKLSIGDPMPAISATDQHEKPYAVEPTTERVLVSFEMGTGKQANAYLEKQGPDYLPRHKAVFVANIHGMPGIGRVFALPKMRKYGHRILLADEEGLLDDIPQEKDKVTVIALDPEGRIASVSFWSPKSGEEPF